jgi:hypothetical protein
MQQQQQQPTEDTLFKNVLQKRYKSQFSVKLLTGRKEIRLYFDGNRVFFVRRI